MSKYQRENKSNFSDYNSLNTYCKGLGIPSNVKTAGGESGPAKPFQVVATFKGFDYINPDYNSLNADSRGGNAVSNNYASINQAYLTDENNGGGSEVTYVRRMCPNC
jgi:hypothetical protein